jgi:hypothetical protein
MPALEWNTLETIAGVNGSSVIVYSSIREKGQSGLTERKLVICDEFAFFDSADQQQVLPVLGAFRAKSDTKIVLLSTPGPLNNVIYNLTKR